ncbi:hypothetical protein MKZ38_005926 [Zalerion maritima]|uniref:5'-nucleotidase n=1 Tax=Zalerion maritima TaxID=339359 RepID=A0AAD5WWZ1_9PEZI|nr:hypothetical protein MKZ38_005926 [Zalerion maritima]
MVPSFKTFVSTAIATSTIFQGAVAEDVLVSRRKLNKRFIDDDGHFNMSFYHINDVHAHLDEFSSSGTDCTDPEEGCYGGYARVKTVVDESRPDHPDNLFLNAGDEFQGTLFYSFYKGEKIGDTINQLGFDGMTIGNHEFDDGDDTLGEFLQNLTFPIISANIVSDHEVLNKTIKPYHIYEEYELAVIGVTTETTASISNPGKGTTFTDAIEAVQNTVDYIRENTNITRIVALTHIGYDEDQALGEKTTGIHLIMGGHSHTKLGDFDDAEGDYPTIVENLDGEEVFVVTAWRWGEFLGYIDVTFDDDGKILEYHGAPVHLTNTTEQDEDLQTQIEEWRGPFEEFAAEVVGEAEVELDQTNCQEQECYLGDVMCDAMMWYRQQSSDTADFALINAGGIRATIDEGEITRGEILTAFPFGNAIVELTFSGEELWKILEGAVSLVNQFSGEELGGFFQVSKEIRVEYNPGNEAGSQLVSVTINEEDLDLETDYQMVTLDFLAGGGDYILPEQDSVITLDLQEEVLIDYITENSPIGLELDGRISQVDGSANSTNGTAGGDNDESEGDDTEDDESAASAMRFGTAVLSLAISAAAMMTL